jgi:hypothetical protein
MSTICYIFVGRAILKYASNAHVHGHTQALKWRLDRSSRELFENGAERRLRHFFMYVHIHYLCIYKYYVNFRLIFYINLQIQFLKCLHGGTGSNLKLKKYEVPYFVT